MAIKTEIYGPYYGGGNLIRTYSDAGYRIRQDGTGAVYDEAIDPEVMGRTYTETDEPIPVDPEQDEITASELLDILLGVDEEGGEG